MKKYVLVRKDKKNRQCYTKVLLGLNDDVCLGMGGRQYPPKGWKAGSISPLEDPVHLLMVRSRQRAPDMTFS